MELDESLGMRAFGNPSSPVFDLKPGIPPMHYSPVPWGMWPRDRVIAPSPCNVAVSEPGGVGVILLGLVILFGVRYASL